MMKLRTRLVLAERQQIVLRDHQAFAWRLKDACSVVCIAIRSSTFETMCSTQPCKVAFRRTGIDVEGALAGGDQIHCMLVEQCGVMMHVCLFYQRN